jgi:glycosyltransferase involved in cell wall biosynthesis
MKILILSAYTNAELRKHLQLKEYGKTASFLIKMNRLSNRTKVIDKALWVGDLIKELKKQEGVEIVSVSPQIKMAKRVESFIYDGVNYYFYSADFSQVARLVKNYWLWKRIETCSGRVRKIVDMEEPDIIILFGTENFTVSAPILKLMDYPVLCLLQTVYSNPERAKYTTPNKMIIKLEKEILSNVKYIGTGSKDYYGLIRKINPDLTVLKYTWISSSLPHLESHQKKYDFVNYAFNLDPRKGDEDAVRALAIVKKTHPKVTLNLAGGISESRKEYIMGIVQELGLEDNVSFTPMFERKEDMYRHVLRARYVLLPVKLDLVSTTTREAMYYGLPVITNITPGTPALNAEKQCVLLAEKGNIESLAKRMLEVMENKELAKMLSENGHEYMVKQMDNRPKMERNMKIIKSVIENYNEGAMIPEDLLLDKI